MGHMDWAGPATRDDTRQLRDCVQMRLVAQARLALAGAAGRRGGRLAAAAIDRGEGLIRDKGASVRPTGGDRDEGVRAFMAGPVHGHSPSILRVRMFV